MSARTSVLALTIVPVGGAAAAVTLRTPPAPCADRFDAAAAARLTHHIRDAWMDIGAQIARLRELVEEARTNEAWRLLGFSSWTAYLRDVLPPLCLPREQRREVVAWMTGTGMSTRAIAPIVGADQKTIVNDRRTIAAARDAASEEISSVAAITGLNGKIYAASTPPARPALAVVPTIDEPAEHLQTPASATGREIFVELLRRRLESCRSIDIEAWNLALERARQLEAAELPEFANS